MRTSRTGECFLDAGRLRRQRDDIGDAVATALDAASVLLGDGIHFSSPGLPRIDLEPISGDQAGAVTILRFRVPK